MDVMEKLVELLTEFYGCDPMYYDVNAFAIADHLIANGVTVQEWTPVTERLPQEDGSYLVTINSFNGLKYIDVRLFAKDGEIVDKYELAGQENVWYYYDSEWGYISIDSVTHWMPLPEMPKGE